jgi:NAD(P)-dependent dehydrogenase (short-subunit alcohol dehydrogenase family)
MSFPLSHFLLIFPSYPFSFFILWSFVSKKQYPDSRSPLTLLRTALPHFNNSSTNPSGGVMLLTSSIAALLPGGSSMGYSVTKAAQVHLMKCLAKTQGPNVRVNAIAPGLLLTEWVSEDFPPPPLHRLLLFLFA